LTSVRGKKGDEKGKSRGVDGCQPKRVAPKKELELVVKERSVDRGRPPKGKNRIRLVGSIVSRVEGRLGPA